MYTSAKTKLLAVFGYPVGHTMSPKLHSILAEKTNNDAVYIAISASPEEFSEKAEALKSLHACGFNITIPHKLRVMEHLDVIDDNAKIIGAVNTAENKDGVWYGYNTDGIGFLKYLDMNNISVKEKNILMLGAGGGARSIAYSMAKDGAYSISITARTPEKAESIGKIITDYSKCKFNLGFDKTKKYDIIINTTPLGMHPHENENPFDNFEMVNENTVCCDLIYNPWETLFLKEAKKRGAKTVNGLGMLVFQGIYAFEHFMNEKYDDSFFEEIYNIFSEDYRK